MESATVSADGKTVSLTVAGVKPGRVVHIRSPRPFSAADGEQLWSTEVWYTANAVPGYQSPADQGYYEAEEATILGGAAIATDHSKYSGSGFVANMTTRRLRGHLHGQRRAGRSTARAPALLQRPEPERQDEGRLADRQRHGGRAAGAAEHHGLEDVGVRDPRAQPQRRAPTRSRCATTRATTDGSTSTCSRSARSATSARRKPAGAGYTSLFDGTLDSLTGWRQASAGSFARQPDCSLKTVGNAGMLWWPGERFDKYSLKLDWKLAGDDNSGVFVGFPDPGNDWNVAFTRGHEVQIDATDDADSTTGSIYNYSAPDAAARDAALNPPGQWNAYEIIVEGQRIQVFLNGVKINDYTNTDPNRMTVPGFIGVQNHAAGDDVFFRNIRLKKLDQGENAAPVIETATATPASGPAPLAVSFAATATDPDGDALTYAWDLDGDGTFETDGQTPSRTYETPRLYAPAVRVTDPDGASATRTLAVTVQPATTKTEVPGSVGGTVPGVLALTLGASANLGAFMPGVDRDYTGSLTGTVTSSAGAAALTVHDPSTTATGRLVNGPWSLPQPLQMRAGSGAFAPLSSAGAPLPLTQFTTPVGLQPVTIEVKQPIAATDSLRAGEYAKTLIFTLTATTP